MKRRPFLKQSLLTSGALLTTGILAEAQHPSLKLSLAEWSLHRALESKEIDNLDFPGIAKNRYDIDTVEYVNQFFQSADTKYTSQLLQRSNDAGVFNHLIMIDNEGPLALPSDAERLQAVDNHKKWIEAAKFLGCKTVRVNLHGDGETNAKKSASIDSLSRLGEFAKPLNINVVVENHGSDSSKGTWLADVMKGVNKPNVGLLPDFGNFCITHPWGSTEQGCENAYDRYQGVKEMLPFAKGGVSAKSYDFNDKGEQPLIDYGKMFGILKASGFKGYVGIEFEGAGQSEDSGIRNTIALVKKYW